MTLSEYLDSCLRTWANRDAHDRLRNAALGIAGETGEIVEVVKKMLYHNKTSDECRVLANGEIGDLFYYLAVYVHERGWNLPELAKIIGASGDDWGDIQVAVKWQSSDGDIFSLTMRLSSLSGKLSAFTLNHMAGNDIDLNEPALKFETVSTITTLVHILHTAILIANYFLLDAEGIAKYNVEKLKGRHPQGWKVL